MASEREALQPKRRLTAVLANRLCGRSHFAWVAPLLMAAARTRVVAAGEGEVELMVIVVAVVK